MLYAGRDDLVLVMLVVMVVGHGTRELVDGSDGHRVLCPILWLEHVRQVYIVTTT